MEKRRVYLVPGYRGSVTVECPRRPGDSLVPVKKCHSTNQQPEKHGRETQVMLFVDLVLRFIFISFYLDSFLPTAAAYFEEFQETI